MSEDFPASPGLAGQANDTPPRPRIHAYIPAQHEQPWHDTSYLLSVLSEAHFGVWSWELRSGRVLWSRQAQALFGVDLDAMADQHADYIDLVLREDRRTVAAAFESAVRNADEHLRLEHRIK